MSPYRSGPLRDASPFYEWPPDDEEDLPHLRASLERELVDAASLRLRIAPLGDLQSLVDAIGAAPRPLLRQLVLADYVHVADEWEDATRLWAPLGDVSQLWPKLPALETLTLRGIQSMSFGEIVLPMARSVAIRGGLSRENLASIAAADWPQVERLEILFGDPDEGDISGCVDFSDVRGGCVDDIIPILSGKGLPRLRHLGLTCCRFLDDLVDRLDEITILPQLTTLDLSFGALSEEAENTLYEKRTRFSHLKSLGLVGSVQDLRLDRADWYQR